MVLRTLITALCLSAVATGRTAAFQPEPAPPASPPPQGASGTQAPSSNAYTAAELEELLGPIALYPDDLLAQVLAACVYPDEVREAANFVKSGGDKAIIDSRDWEPPVKSIAKIPDVAKMMGDFPDWVTAVGQAYLTQSQDVMATIQSLRKKASASGALRTTPQQKVEQQDGNVIIVSSDPEIVYVPSYSPSVVYVDDDDDEWAAGLIGFGTGIAVGVIWAGVACDWDGGCLGWGHGDVDIDIDRNFNGDINVGNRVGSGNRVNNGNRIGKEGGAWSPNRAKPVATACPSQAQNFRSSSSLGGPRGSTPAASSSTRPKVTSRPAGSRPSSAAGRPSQPARVSAPAASPRMPATPSPARADSAFRGGSDTRAASNRGSSSRASADRSSGGRTASGSRSGGSRSGGASRGGGGRGGGGRR